MSTRKNQPFRLENFSDEVPSPELMISTGREITIRMDGGGHANVSIEMKTTYDICGLDPDPSEVESRLMDVDGRGLRVTLNEAERARLVEWLAKAKA